MVKQPRSQNDLFNLNFRKSFRKASGIFRNCGREQHPQNHNFGAPIFGVSFLALWPLGSSGGAFAPNDFRKASGKSPNKIRPGFCEFRASKHLFFWHPPLLPEKLPESFRNLPGLRVRRHKICKKGRPGDLVVLSQEEGSRNQSLIYYNYNLPIIK